MSRSWNRALGRVVLGGLSGSALLVSLLFTITSLSTSGARAATPLICPSVGADTPTASGTGCNFIVTVAADGSVSTQGNIQPGYDGGDNSDDSLVGIVNNTSATIASLPVFATDGTPIFNFDGDGVCNYYGNPVGDESALAYCSTAQLSGLNDAVSGADYQGPWNTFTGINGAKTSAVLNFSGFAPGTTTFFSIEALSTAAVTASKPALLSATISLATPSLTYGGVGTYNVTVANTGSATSGVTTISDTLPLGETFTSGGASGFACSAVLQVVTCSSSSSVASGTSVVVPINFALTAQAQAGDVLVDGASVDGGPSGQVSDTVQKAVAHLVAPDASMVYGGPLLPLGPVSGSGFVLGQGVAVLTQFPACAPSATVFSSVGTYSIDCSGAAALNYTFTYGTGTLAVTKKEALVTAGDVTVQLHHPLPAILPTYSGLVGSDTASVVSGTVCTTNARSDSPLGTYKSTCTGATSPNYTFTYVSGRVLVTDQIQVPVVAPAVSTTSTTTTTTTTTLPPRTKASHKTAPTTTTTVPVSPAHYKIGFCGPPGTKIAGCQLTITGGGVKPFSEVIVDVHSTPTRLGSTTAGADGSFQLNVHLPSHLAPGGHHVLVNEDSYTRGPLVIDMPFTVTLSGLLGSIGTIPPGPLATYLPLVPANNRSLVLATALGGAVALTAASASLAGGAMSRGGGGGSDLISEGLVDVELEREEAREQERRREDARGDNSITWKAPGHKTLRHFSKHVPARIAKLSPVIARVIIDGDYLRAMFGSIWLLVSAASVGLGVYASSTTSWYAVPPSLALFLIILGLSIFDSTWGYVAGFSFVASSLFAGHITTAPEVREACGLVLVWFAVPLAAAAIRPLRRAIHLKLDSVWERVADVVIAGLFAAWVTQKMLTALSVLVGADLPISKHVLPITISVFLFISGRIALETIAMMHYPARLEDVRHEGEFRPVSWHEPLSLLVQVGVFVFVAAAFVGAAWSLLIGAVVFFAPSVLEIFEEKFSKSEFLTKWTPRALVKWSLILVMGAAINVALKHGVHRNTLAEDIGFIILPLPMVLFWLLELFKDPEEEPETPPIVKDHRWLYRFAGVALVILSTSLVVTHLVA